MFCIKYLNIEKKHVEFIYLLVHHGSFACVILCMKNIDNHRNRGEGKFTNIYEQTAIYNYLWEPRVEKKPNR